MVDSDSDELSCCQDNDGHMKDQSDGHPHPKKNYAEKFKSSDACEMFKSVKMGKKLG
jgi:hypothetical protein